MKKILYANAKFLIVLLISKELLITAGPWAFSQKSGKVYEKIYFWNYVVGY